MPLPVLHFYKGKNGHRHRVRLLFTQGKQFLLVPIPYKTILMLICITGSGFSSPIISLPYHNTAAAGLKSHSAVPCNTSTYKIVCVIGIKAWLSTVAAGPSGTVPYPPHRAHALLPSPQRCPCMRIFLYSYFENITIGFVPYNLLKGTKVTVWEWNLNIYLTVGLL